MAERIHGKQTVPLDEVVIAQAYELEALLVVLEWKGLLTKAEVLDEIARQKKDRVCAR